jgi:hypothetical protein
MQSTAATVEQYLAELPADRRAILTAVRNAVRPHLDPVLQEGMTWGMLGWSIPHSVYPAGYHTKPEAPVPYACLASQKNYISLYLPIGYADGSEGEKWFRREWAKTGKKLNMGKTCVRFTRVEDLALDVIAESLRRFTATDYLKLYAAIDPRTNGGQAAKKKRVAKKAPKRAAKKK